MNSVWLKKNLVFSIDKPNPGLTIMFTSKRFSFFALLFYIFIPNAANANSGNALAWPTYYDNGPVYNSTTPSAPYTGSDCSSCHGTGGGYSGSASVSGDATPAVGQTTNYTFNFTSNAVQNGFSLSVKNSQGSRVGAFSNAGTGVKISDIVDNQTTTSNHVTQDTPKANPDVIAPISSYSSSWTFSWQAPTSPSTLGDVYTMYWCLNQVNGDAVEVIVGPSPDFIVTYNDGPPVCSSKTITITNTPPVANPDAKSVNENSTTTIQVKDNNGSGADNDGDAFLTQTLSVTNVNRVASAGNGSVTETATDGLVTYDPAGQFESLAFGQSTPDIFTYTLSDGVNTSAGTVTMTITGVNDAPVVASSAAITYTEVQPPVAKVIDAGITVTDVDNGATIKSATVSITNNGEAEDVLACGTVAAGITCSGSYPTLTLTSATTNTLTEYRNALRGVTFKNTSLNPTPSTRTITYQVTDDQNQPSATDTATVAVVAVSFAPVVSNFTSTPVTTFTENGSVPVDDSVDLADSDSPLLNQALMTLTNIQAGDSLVCPGAVSLATGMSCTYTAPTLEISSTGNTPAEYKTAIQAVTFTNSSDNPSVVDRNVALTIRDSGNTSSTPVSSKIIKVTAVNDSPTSISEPPVKTATEEVQYSFTFVAVDPDDANDGTELTYSIFSGAETGMAINNTAPDHGVFTWTPPRTGVFGNTFDIVVQATDGDVGSTPVKTSTITLMVSPLDSDLDNVADYSDNCPNIANGSQTDFLFDTQFTAVDSSGIPSTGDVIAGALDANGFITGGDACDEDDDDDGIPDSIEDALAFPFLDSKNPADALLDEDGDGLTNLEEYNNDNSGATINVDSVGPVVSVPADVTVDATGYLTVVDIGTATANDGNEGTITSLVAAVDIVAPTDLDSCDELKKYSSKVNPFRPGLHTVTWATCDSANNFGKAEQTVIVRPLITTGKGQTIGEGQVASVDVFLNGDADAASYPVTVDYALGGSTATIVDDHDAISGTISITDPDIDGNTPGRVGRLDINIVNDGLAEPDETIVVTLLNPVNAALGAAKVNTVTITEANVPPQVVLDVTQPTALLDVNKGNTLYQTDGIARLTVNASDANGDALTVDWGFSDSNLLAISTISSNQIEFDPNTLMPGGLYNVSVAVSDGASTVTIDRLLLIKAGEINVWTPTDDNDGDGVYNLDEGYGDDDADGIPNYLDNSFSAPNAIENQTGKLSRSFIIETDAGLKIRKGTTAVAAGVDGVLISQLQLEANGGQAGGVAVNAVDEYANTSGLYDFEISGLNPSIIGANVVIPLPSAIEANSAYRKYNVIDGWFSFVEDSNNSVSSAPGKLGVCPPPGSSKYKPGLTVLDYCVQLSIEDGGPNDADRTRNFVIKDPGGAAVAPEVTKAKAAADGRIGVIHPLLLLIMLLPLAYTYRLQIRREFVRIINRQKRNRY